MRNCAAYGLLLALVPVSGVFAQTAAPAAGSADRAREMFAKADLDKDGTLSLSEWKALGRKERGFKMMDADHDGKLTPEEIKAAIAAYQKRK